MGEAARRSKMGAPNKLGPSIAQHFDHKDQVEEQRRRDRIKQELDRIKGLVDEGKFEAMVVAELVGFTADGKPKVMHTPMGEVHQIQAMCAHVVMHYGEKKNPLLKI